MLTTLSPTALLSCFVVCRSWRSDMMKIWNEDKRHLAVLLAAIRSRTKDFEALKRKGERLKLKERFSREEYEGWEKEILDPITKQISTLSQTVQEFKSIVWSRSQPEYINNADHQIPFPPFTDQSLSKATKYYVTSKTEPLPKEFCHCKRTDSISEAFRNSTPEGIIYISDGTFKFDLEAHSIRYHITKDLQIIGMSRDVSKIQFLGQKFEELCCGSCSVLFRNVSIEIGGRFGITKSNLWLDCCELNCNYFGTFLKSNLFISKCIFRASGRNAIHIAKCANWVVMEDTTFIEHPQGRVALHIQTTERETSMKLCFRRNDFSGYRWTLVVISDLGDYLEDPKHFVSEGNVYQEWRHPAGYRGTIKQIQDMTILH